jgi:hypothetical protein
MECKHCGKQVGRGEGINIITPEMSTMDRVKLCGYTCLSQYAANEAYIQRQEWECVCKDCLYTKMIREA